MGSAQTRSRNKFLKDPDIKKQKKKTADAYWTTFLCQKEFSRPFQKGFFICLHRHGGRRRHCFYFKTWAPPKPAQGQGP